MEKPDGLTVLRREDVEMRLWPLPIRKLYGVGPKTETPLRGMGVETIGQLASWSTDGLLAQFGRSYGLYLYEAARGISFDDGR
jgi:DNA polymerase IV